MEGCLIREWREGDFNFILSTWLKSYKSSGWCDWMPVGLYMDNHRKVICEMLKRGTCLVACSEEDPDTIMGWGCKSENEELHYLYVKKVFWGFGLGLELLHALFHERVRLGDLERKEDEIRSSHMNEVFHKIYRSRVCVIFNPYLIGRYVER